MNRILLCLILLWSVVSFGQDKKTIKKLNNQKEDFHVFKTSIFELEARPYRYISKDSLNELLDNLEKKVSTEIVSDIDLYRSYASLMVHFQSGHTGIIPTKHVYRQWFLNKNSLPFDIIISAGKMYSYNEYLNVPEKQFLVLPRKEQKRVKIEMYAEITKIDGLDLAEWMDRIGTYVGSDENQPEFRYEIVKELFEFFRGLTLDSVQKEANVSYVSGKDTLEMIVPIGYAPGKDISERLELSQKEAHKVRKDFGSFKELGGRYGYLQLPSFTNSYGKKYNRFLKDVFSKIHKKGVKELVIDLRGNTGGVMQNELLKYFLVAQKEVGEYHIEKVKKPNYKKYIEKNDSYRQNKKNLKAITKWEKDTWQLYDGISHPNIKDEDDEYYLGKIVVLTDRSTFSAASVLAAQLKHMKGAKIVGTTAGGSFYEGVAGTHKVILPNSKFALLVNPNYYKTPLSGIRPFDQSVKTPDIVYQDLFGEPKVVDKKNERALLKALKQAFALIPNK